MLTMMFREGWIRDVCRGIELFMVGVQLRYAQDNISRLIQYR
jgi:hypothetical protein